MQKSRSYRESREIGIYAFQKYRLLINNHIDNYTSHKLWVLLFYPHHKAYTVSCDLVTFTEEILNGKFWTVSLHHMEGHDFSHKLLVAWVNSANSRYHMERILFWKSEPFLLPSMKLPFHGTPLKGNFYTFSQNICPRTQYNSHRMNLKVFCTNNIPLYRTKQLLKTSLQCYVS